MNVRELIAALQALPEAAQDLPVRIEYDNESWTPAVAVVGTFHERVFDHGLSEYVNKTLHPGPCVWLDAPGG